MYFKSTPINKKALKRFCTKTHHKVVAFFGLARHGGSCIPTYIHLLWASFLSFLFFLTLSGHKLIFCSISNLHRTHIFTGTRPKRFVYEYVPIYAYRCVPFRRKLIVLLSVPFSALARHDTIYLNRYAFVLTLNPRLLLLKRLRVFTYGVYVRTRTLCTRVYIFMYIFFYIYTL